MGLTDVHLLMLLRFPSLDEKKLVGIFVGIIIIVADSSVLGAYCVKHALTHHSFD